MKQCVICKKAIEEKPTGRGRPNKYCQPCAMMKIMQTQKNNYQKRKARANQQAVQELPSL